MTNIEFIRAKLPEYLVSDSVIKTNLAFHELDACAEADFDSFKKELDLAYADCLKYVLRLPTSISQGGFSFSIEKEVYSAELQYIYNTYGMGDISDFIHKPDITNAGEWQ